MPYKIRKLPDKNEYKVSNKKTGVIHSKGSTLANAKKQITLLNMIDHNVPLRPMKAYKCGCGCGSMSGTCKRMK